VTRRIGSERGVLARAKRESGLPFAGMVLFPWNLSIGSKVQKCSVFRLRELTVGAYFSRVAGMERF